MNRRRDKSAIGPAQAESPQFRVPAAYSETAADMVETQPKSISVAVQADKKRSAVHDLVLPIGQMGGA